MLKLLLKIPFRRRNRPSKPSSRSLEWRFIARVLAPPFIILLVLGAVALWQIDRFITGQSINELTRSASSTAAKLEREFAIRQTILSRTGEELFKIKDDYQRDRASLDKSRTECANYVRQKRTYTGAPANICTPFIADLALKGSTLANIEDSYVKSGTQLAQNQESKIKDKLSAFNQFFPETRVLIIADDKNQVVSLATSDIFQASTQEFLPYLNNVKNEPVEGSVITIKDMRLAVFAYPITAGSVLAAYDLTSNSFIRQTWESTPIEKSHALAVILDAQGQTAYPELAEGDVFKRTSSALRSTNFNEIYLNGTPHIAVGSEAGKSHWLVAVASPRAAVFGPLHDAQLAAVIIIGFLLVGFLWMGAIFIQRTVKTIMRLVSGALLFSRGKLDYIIQTPNADKEFAQLAETMNIMAWRISDAEKQIDKKNKEFISIATHELRTPLTAILGNLSMVTEDYGDKLHGPIKPLIEQAHNGTLRLRDLVNDMLDMARLEGGRTEFVIAKQDMRKCIQDVIDTLRITAKDQNITLKYQNAFASPVMADAAKLRIILNNFISNAIKYNHPGGSVTVSHKYKDDMLITGVTDTGLGIPEDQKARMFEKFFRVTNADRQNVTGTGLGMYITKRYILAMGGQVWFDSVHGKGTTFYFSLPLAKDKSPTKPAHAKFSVAEDQKLIGSGDLIKPVL